jgi:PAS domain S-box-containing protein
LRKGFQTLARDITERKRAEADLQQTNDLLRAIIEAAPTAIIGLDLEGIVRTVWNPAAEKMLGWSAQEAIGGFLPTVGAHNEEAFQEFRDLIRSGRTLNGVEVRRERRDGAPIDYSVYASPLYDRDGQVVGNVAVLVDITERKRAEEEREKLQAQLLQAQKSARTLISLGCLGRGSGQSRRAPPRSIRFWPTCASMPATPSRVWASSPSKRTR